MSLKSLKIYFSKLSLNLFLFKTRLFLLRYLPTGAAKNDIFFFGAKTSDISEHLNFLYFYLKLTQPKNILELGTRGGESTRVLEKYCTEMNIIGKSIDLNQAPEWLENSANWRHYKGNDVEIGKLLHSSKCWPDGEHFIEFDFIFVDTSHEYNHTIMEIEIFSKLLRSQVGAMAFHDTNLTSHPTRKLSGEINYGWDNQRGVARALEQFFDFKFKEDTLQARVLPDGNWIFYHQPWNNGFTVFHPI